MKKTSKYPSVFSSLRPLFWHFGDLDLLKLNDVVLLDVVPVHGHDDDEDQHEQEE